MPRRPSAFIALTAAAVLLQGAAANPGRVVSPPDQKAFEVSLAVDGNRAAIAWHGSATGPDAIHFEWLDKEGRPVGAPVAITDGAKFGYEPDLVLVDTDPVIAWYEKDAKSGEMHAYVGRFDPAGRPLWKHELTGGGIQARNPVVRRQGDELDLAWIELPRDATKGPNVWIERLDLAGAVRSAPHIGGEASVNTWNLNAAIDLSGAFHVVYDAQLQNRRNELQMITDEAGQARRHQLTPDDGFASVYPDLAINAAGEAAITWFDAKDGNEEVYLSIGPLSQIADLPSARRITETAAPSVGAYLAWNGARLALAWNDAEPGQNEIYVETFDTAGRTTSAKRRLTQTPDQSAIPSVRADGKGFMLAWNQYRLAGKGGHDDVTASKAVVARVP